MPIWMKDALTFGARHLVMTNRRSLYQMKLFPDNLHALNLITITDTKGVNVWSAAGKVLTLHYSP